MSAPLPRDDQVLADLRDVLGAVDAPPPELVELGRAVFALHALDDDLAVLAVLTEDSAAAAAPTRAGLATERMLSFSAGPVTIDLQLTTSDPAVDVLGEIDPAPRGGSVVVESAAGSVVATAVPDVAGRFLVTVPTAAPLRLRVLRPGGATVSTPWFRP